jgi:hypothetical protein
MRRFLARFSGLESSVHTRYLADFITTSGFRFSVHTPAMSVSCHVWTAPGWQENLHVAGLVGAAMCSAFRCGSYVAPRRGLRVEGSVIECREQFQHVRLCLVMIDEKLGLVCCHHPLNPIHGGY